MSTNPNPLDPMRNVFQKLGEAARELGLEMHQAAVIPGPPEPGGHAPDLCQIMFIISEEAVDPKGVEERKVNEQFEALTKQFAKDEAEAKTEEKVKDIQSDVAKWLEEGK